MTTVLILLGLRWLPPRLGSIAGPTQPAWRTWVRHSRDFTIAVGGGAALAALTYAVLVHPASRTPLPTSSCSMRLAAVVGRTWSTCCWSTSAASTRWARSPSLRSLPSRCMPYYAASAQPGERKHSATLLPGRPGKPADPSRASQQRLPAGARHLPAPATAFHGRDRGLFLHAWPCTTCLAAASWPD